ncbi:MAG: thymidine phosphorylase [Candidatus Micrarchaeota archaeon]
MRCLEPEFTAVVIDVDQGQNEIVLSEADAQNMEIGVLDRVRLTLGKKSVLAIVDVSHRALKQGQIGLFHEVAEALDAKNGSKILICSAKRPASLDAIRKKLDGGILDEHEISEIISDLMHEQLSQAELAAFVSGIYTRGMTTEETVALTNAIFASGGQMAHFKSPIVSEHSIGGVAGDRSSMLLVPIIASLGIVIPKTCTRAISSAAGTADVMEVFCPVALSLEQAQTAVEKTGGCLAWGGNMDMAAADDRLIKIRNPLHLDPQPLLLSSILAKKKAEGAEFVLIDLPEGRGAKLASVEAARALARDFEALGAKLGMKIQCTITDGSEPLSEFAGPALEARNVLSLLTKKSNGPLLEKALIMSGLLISLVKGVPKEDGYLMAKHQFTSGKALEKFWEIVKAQGGKQISIDDIKIGEFTHLVTSNEQGKIAHVDNRAVSRLCRSLGAPQDKRAGIELHVSKGKQVDEGSPLVTLYASSQEKLDFGLSQFNELKLVEIERIVLDVV